MAEASRKRSNFHQREANKTRQSDRDYVLANSHEDILDVQIVHDASPDFVANECSDPRRPVPPNSAPATNDFPVAAQRLAPLRPPRRNRANNGAKAVRFGVPGSLSAINSPMAKVENIATAAVDPINARGEPCRFNQPKCAAQATTAGGSNERKPATNSDSNCEKENVVHGRFFSKTRTIASLVSGNGSVAI